MSSVIIVGGGISGLLSALELNAAGLNVTLLEKELIGRESSWAGGGIVSPLYPWRYPQAVSDLTTWSQARYPVFCAQLFAETGINPEFTCSGMLIIDTDEHEAALAWADQQQVDLRLVKRIDLLEWETNLNPHYEQALWLPNVAQVRNPRLLKSLYQAAHQRGVRCLEKQAVEDFIYETDRITAVKTKTQTYRADYVVLTMGAWSNDLLHKIASPLRIEPVRGQMLLFSTQAGLISHIVMMQGRYIIPRRDGHVLVGSTLEYAGFDKQTTDEARKDLTEAAYDLVPALADYALIGHWAGLRPGTPDGIPLISAHPQYQNLFINAGHFRNGIVLGLASARLLADILLEREPIMATAPYQWISP